MHKEQLHKIFCAQGFGGLHFTNMGRSISSHVMYANEWENHIEGTKCL
jgi:hypothetical protein